MTLMTGSRGFAVRFALVAIGAAFVIAGCGGGGPSAKDKAAALLRAQTSTSDNGAVIRPSKVVCNGGSGQGPNCTVTWPDGTVQDCSVSISGSSDSESCTADPKATASTQTAAAREVAQRYLTALVTGDGRTFCSLLSAERLAAAEKVARQFGPHVTCEQAQSTHPPGWSAADLADLAKARQQESTGLRIDSVTIHNGEAAAQYSWMWPAHPDRFLSQSQHSASRAYGTLHLVQVGTSWKLA